MLEKKTLGVEELEAQAALELPERVLPALVNILVTDVLNGNQVAVQVPIGIAANLCGINANILAHQEGPPQPINCTGSTTQDLPVAFRP